MAGPDDTLSEIRREIDEIDGKFLKLLNKRASLARRVADVKRTAGTSFYRPARERELIDSLQERNPGPFPTTAIRPVFQEIVSACLSLEEGIQVAYLGPKATFTHQAVRRHFGSSAQTVSCASIGAVFAEVERGVAAFGVVPVENSSEGIVNHTLDCFVQSDVVIAAEIVVDVEHCLIAGGRTDLADVQRVYSHPQALAQCRSWLEANLPRVIQVESSSTADAARAAAEDAKGAAVAAELAAREYNLRVLRRKLQDQVENVTRFLVLSRGQKLETEGCGDHKTTLLLTLPDKPGALLSILQRFSEANINLTKIESRPSREKAWDYVFFLDLDGHGESDTIAPILEELASSCQLFKVLGSYRKADTL